jgi:hypothetical protein
MISRPIPMSASLLDEPADSIQLIFIDVDDVAYSDGKILEGNRLRFFMLGFQWLMLPLLCSGCRNR